MKFEHTETWGFEHALRGMRNPKNSWSKSDSNFDNVNDCVYPEMDECEICPYFDGFDRPCICKIGPNDMKLAQTLIKGGSEHRKFLRQIFVSVDITAPLYWWKEFDTYKIGTVANSTSTMHKITSNPITIDCFEVDDMPEYCTFMSDFLGRKGLSADDCESMVYNFIDFLEGLRTKYLETKDKRYWKELIRWLPESWLQTRTVTMNYENLYSMVHQRQNHKLIEWSGTPEEIPESFISWAKTLPYAKEFIFAEQDSTSWVKTLPNTKEFIFVKQND